MKLRLIAWFAVALLAQRAARAQTPSGKVSAARGDVWVRPPEKSEAKAVVGASLLPGTRIRTGADADSLGCGQRQAEGKQDETAGE